MNVNDLLHTAEDIAILQRFNARAMSAWSHDYRDAVIMAGGNLWVRGEDKVPAHLRLVPHHTALIGKRVEIPVHYNTWARGARMGTVTAYRKGEAGYSDHLLVRMDNPNVKRRLKLWRIDWEYAKFV